MNHLTRSFVLASYFKFMRALPHIGPNGLHPDLKPELQVSPLTLHHLHINKVFDLDLEGCVAGHLAVAYGNIPDGRLQFALVSKP